MHLIRRLPHLILITAPWQWHCDYPHFKENLGHREVTSILLKVTNVLLAKLTSEAPGSGSHIQTLRTMALHACGSLTLSCLPSRASSKNQPLIYTSNFFFFKTPLDVLGPL